MPTFYYSAINNEEKKLSGVMDALTEREVRDHLRLQGFILLQLKCKEKVFKAAFSKEDVLGFVIQLHQLLEAGLPLYESLVTLEEQSSTRHGKALLATLAERVHEGSSFAEALSLFPHIFDARFRAMIQAGLSSGMLPSVLKEIISLLDKKIKLIKQLQGAILYPALLGSFALCVILCLLFFVIPSLEGLFEGKELEGITYIVVTASQLLREYWSVILITVISVAAAIFLKKEAIFKSPKVFQLYLKLPFIKTVLLKMALARFFRTLATLQNGGVNLIDALGMSKEVMHFPPLEKIIQEAIDRVIEGSFLSIELKKSALIPSLVTRMLAIGEQTAQGAHSFLKIAEIFEDDVEKGLLRFGTILQPVILIFMGIVVGMVMLSVLLPLTDMGNLVN